MAKYVDESGLTRLIQLIKAALALKADKNHASTGTDYGKGTDSNYGHVKLSDSTSGTSAAASGGTAATPKAVKDALDAAKAYADANDEDTTYGLSISGRTISLVDNGSTQSVTVPETSVDVFDGATGSADGSPGLVPGPVTDDYSRYKVLVASGIWDSIVTNIFHQSDYVNVKIDHSGRGNGNGGGVSGLYSTIQAATSTKAGVMTATDKSNLDALVAAGPEANVQSDWNQTTTTADDYIKNKPGDFVGVVGSTDVGVSGFVPAPENTAGHRSGNAFLNARGDWWYITNGTNTSLTIDATDKTVALDATNTKNTAGATDSSSKLFLIGATTQGTNPQTYSQDTAYVGTNGHLYSNSKQVVNLSDTQALTNKTYNGYTLGAACAKAIGSVANGDTGLVTGDAVYDAIQSSIVDVVGYLVYKGTVSAASGMTSFKKGWSWIASASFTIGSGNDIKSVEPGDMLIANADGASASTSNIDVIQTNIETLTTTEVATIWTNTAAAS